MRVLIIGGSGHVGTLILPYLREHSIRVFDLRIPDAPLESVEYVTGNVCDAEALSAAMQGVDAFIYMAMGQVDPSKGNAWGSASARSASFDVNVKGLYFALEAAHGAGVSHGVYASSLSVFESMTWGRGEKQYYVDEDMPADARPVYGLTKRLGEEVCRNATREWAMSVTVLRLCLPISTEKWLERTKPGEPTIATAAPDVAAAFAAALKFRAGYQVFHISGDYEQKLMRLTRAEQLLGWKPLARPRAGEDG